MGGDAAAAAAGPQLRGGGEGLFYGTMRQNGNLEIPPFLGVLQQLTTSKIVIKNY